MRNLMIRAGLGAIVTFLAMVLMTNAPASSQGFYSVRVVADNGVASPFVTFERPELPPPSNYTVPSINETGEVAFFARLKTSGEGILLASKGDAILTVADHTSMALSLTLSEFGPGPAINDSGQVAFTARLSDGRQAVLRSCVGCAPVVIAVSGVQFTDFTL